MGVWIMIYSIDGASHDITCTAVTGWFGLGYPYSTKNITVSGTLQTSIFWDAFDWGGGFGDQIPDSTAFSITCLLPPQTAINFIQGDFLYEIGS